MYMRLPDYQYPHILTASHVNFLSRLGAFDFTGDESFYFPPTVDDVDIITGTCT